jgi:hypothetical protein
VTNLQNRRSIIVRVNDRGPYRSDRIIDLSRRSVEALGFRDKGTAPVRVQYLARARSMATTATSAAISQAKAGRNSRRAPGRGIRVRWEASRVRGSRRTSRRGGTEWRAGVATSNAEWGAAAPLAGERRVPDRHRPGSNWAASADFSFSRLLRSEDNAERARSCLAASPRSRWRRSKLAARPCFAFGLGLSLTKPRPRRRSARVTEAGYTGAKIIMN